MSSREFIKLLVAAGWTHDRTVGSHNIYVHATKGTISVPHPRKDMPTGLLRKLAKQAGVTLP